MRIDREALVTRHSVRLAAVDPGSFVTLGNGEFAFSADVTGLQTFNGSYECLNTQAHWGWHRVPVAAAHANLSTWHERAIRVSGHTAFYPAHDPADRQPDAIWNFLRANPHRLNLMRTFLRRRMHDGKPGAPIAPGEVGHIRQTLNMWSGTVDSKFELDGAAVRIQTAVHPRLDAVALRLCSPLVAERRLAVGLAFPYGSEAFKGGSNWDAPRRHTSAFASPPQPCDASPVLLHTLDETSYYVHLRLNSSGGATSCPQLWAEARPHDWSIGLATEGSTASCIEVSLWLAPLRQPAQVPSVAETFEASAAYWPSAWRRGAALELAGSSAPGAFELEARTVLSQWISMTQEAGSNPPQETGLMTNSWCERALPQLPPPLILTLTLTHLQVREVPPRDEVVSPGSLLPVGAWRPRSTLRWLLQPVCCHCLVAHSRAAGLPRCAVAQDGGPAGADGVATR